MHPSLRKRFNIRNFAVISQDPTAVSDVDRIYSFKRFLPAFLLFWKDLETATGHRWKSTSYLRDSPSHRRGHSFDLAPDIAPSAEKLYAVNNNSDPVLYKREPLIRALQSLSPRSYGGSEFDLGVFIEPDHLHVQVLAPERRFGQATHVYKWKVPKPVYPDTIKRMNLPMFS